MEATEKSVSNETSLLPDGLRDDEQRILEVLRKAKVSGDRHMTKVRIAQEMGAHGHAMAEVWRTVSALAKRKMIIERVDDGTKESNYVIADSQPRAVPIHRRTYETVAAAALRSKVKQLYEDGFKYEEIRLQLGIPRGTVSTVVRRLIAKGEIKPRGQGKRGPKAIIARGPPSPTFLELHEHGPEEANRDPPDKEEEKDDEPEAEDEPTGGTLLEKLKKIVDELEQNGFKVKVLIEIHYGKLALQGAS